jgi:rhamnosyltransferase
MRLAIYAHHGGSPQIAGYVLFHLQHIAELGFQICFVSNSEISPASEEMLKKFCDRVMVRENTGYDFSMWQRGMAEYDLLQFDELLLTNSSIIGPLKPLAPLWQHPAVADCDFWGLTDNDEFKPHLSSYFLVFRKRVLHSERFRDFWRAVLPYKNKWQVIFSYELGVTGWLEEGGFKWKAVFAQERMWSLFLRQRSFTKKIRDWFLNRGLPGRNTTALLPDLLLQCGMPFLKTGLLRQGSSRISPQTAFEFLEESSLPSEILDELRQEFPIASGHAKKRILPVR